MFIFRYWNRFFGIRCSIFSTLEVTLSRLEVLLPRYCWKCSFASFFTGFTAFSVLFLALWRLFWVDRSYHCKDRCENVHSLKLSGFTVFTVLFLAIWRLFCVDLRYGCQDTGAVWWMFRVNWRYHCHNPGESVLFPTLKHVFGLSSFIFEHFGGFFASLGRTVYKILAKIFLRRLWNGLPMLKSVLWY